MGDLLLQHRERFPAEIREGLAQAADISKRLRKDRDLAFYGEIDFIPTEEYSGEEADRAYADTERIVTLARRVIGSHPA